MNLSLISKGNSKKILMYLYFKFFKSNLSNIQMFTRAEALKTGNAELREKLAQLKSQSLNAHKIDSQIQKFIRESENNVKNMAQQVKQKAQQQNTQIHKLTSTYQALLKRQIQLLNANKELTGKKQSQDEFFNENVEKLTKQYEGKIKNFEKKVKGNVKKIQQLGSNNIIRRLLKSDKFKETMKEKGVNLEVLEKQSQLEDISAEVDEKEDEIKEAETQSKSLDEELSKMRELIETMKELLENMVKQKENIVKQNVILKQKMKQSEELIAKLLGSAVAEQNEENEGKYDEEFEEEEDEDNIEQNDE